MCPHMVIFMSTTQLFGTLIGAAQAGPLDLDVNVVWDEGLEEAAVEAPLSRASAPLPGEPRSQPLPSPPPPLWLMMVWAT
jgi:hypothetical protein